MAASAVAPAGACYHCGLPLPAPVADAPAAVLDGETRRFCCPGCRAVAGLIWAAGNGAYYARRDAPAPRAGPVPARIHEADALADDPEIQRSFVRDVPGGREGLFALEGARCAACAWLVERHLGALDGVVDVQVNVATSRMRAVWRPEAVSPSALLAAIRAIGYEARPHRPDREEARQREARRASLRRLGVSGLGTMQVMMFAVALYAGDATGIETPHRDLLRWASWAVATAVVGFSASPFFRGAWSDLRRRAPGMDVPVALAIGAAYVASAWATLTGEGPVYFESACMFTFLLGLTRHLEMSARHGRDARIRKRLGGLPELAVREGDEGAERVPATWLRPGDRVRLQAGDVVPADGVLLAGSGAVDEALLTGEAAARPARPGERLLGGSRWLERSGVMRVERAGAESTAARIAAILERAQLDRPPAERLADRIAARFVTGVVLVAIGVFAAWRVTSPDDALWVTLSVLVATCPCALSLATPAALASASAGLAERGFLIARGHVLETLGRVTHVVFDKTGTLTAPEAAAGAGDRPGAWPPVECLGLARALERHADHPIARAVTGRPAGPEVAQAESRFAARLRAVEVRPGRGIEARLDGARVRLGRPDWAAPEASGAASSTDPCAAPDADAGDGTRIALAVDGALAGWLDVAAEVRPGAVDLVTRLRARGITVSLSSGDPSRTAVRRLAERVGIASWEAGRMPEDKLAHLAALQDAGETVAVLGDGINDAPMLGRADVGIALGSGADLARVTADAVVLGESLAVVDEAWRQAARTRRIVRQNFTWAVVYNVAVLPAAAAGLVAPWMAALGMSASSLLVVANSLRLRRLDRRGRTQAGAGARAPAPTGRPAWAES